jgi:hypothetical protein
MQLLLIESIILLEIFFIDRELTTETIYDCMNSLVSPTSTTILISALKFGVVVGRQ